MERLMTIDVNDLYKIDGGDSYNMVDELLVITNKISAWIKGLFD